MRPALPLRVLVGEGKGTSSQLALALFGLVLAAVAAALIIVRLITDTKVVSQLALGLGTGALIAGIAVGVVLTYRGSGVVDFSKGAVAIFIGYVFHELRTNGRIVIPPLPNPLALDRGRRQQREIQAGLDRPAQLADVHRPAGCPSRPSSPPSSSRSSSPPSSACSSTSWSSGRCASRRPWPRWWPRSGCSSSSRQSSGSASAPPRSCPRRSSTTSPGTFFGDIVIPQNQLVLALLVIVVAALLYALFRFTRFGLATRAAAENEKGAIVLGFSPDFLAGANWVLATVIVGLFGIIVSPITTLDPIAVPLLIVPALGAALLGGFTSFGDHGRGRPRHRDAAVARPSTTARSIGSRPSRSPPPGWPSRSRSS